MNELAVTLGRTANLFLQKEVRKIFTATMSQGEVTSRGGDFGRYLYTDPTGKGRVYVDLGGPACVVHLNLYTHIFKKMIAMRPLLATPFLRVLFEVDGEVPRCKKLCFNDVVI